MKRAGWDCTGVLVTLLALPLAARGEDILVKNDSIVDFGYAVIVGDFIPGEQAGARLTSPCNGTIIAVHVLWLEGQLGNPPSLEEAIHIYDGGTFPQPGAELALLEGPVLTPGYWNAFQYLDEEQQIPLQVPVTAGQRFYVTLEFANETDVGHGGASVVRDTDGYHSGCNVLYGYIPGYGWHWWDFNGFPVYLAGDIAIRAVVHCPGATGACCHADGTCTNAVEQSGCQAFGDVWHEGLTCAQITCNPRGACCRNNGCLQLVEQSLCQAINGVYAGDGTNCNDNVCVPGACCVLETGDCLQLFEFQCAAIGGSFQGHGTSCDPNPCPQPQGACCVDIFCIPGQLEASCTSAGGEWAGAWTTCADNDHNGVADVCENPCVGQTLGDANCDGNVDGFDIQPFVQAMTDPGAWEAAHPDCDLLCVCALNGSGAVDGFDIQPFVDLLTGK